MKEISSLKYISTKTGDKGYSRNYSNDTVLKTDLLFDTLGNIDELSSSLGVCYHHTDLYKMEIRNIQKDLQNIMSLVATNFDTTQYEKLTKIAIKDINNLENIEQAILDKKPLKPVFVLPGSDSSVEGSYLDLARAIARRVERTILKFKELNERTDLEMSCKYLNRLSDLLFIMARSYDK
ncbi:Cob(I)yrinic acid a,c-diamide adenosyltransferase [Candidatus Izimaplasma bacterium HR1]|jgi:cob(I)alamin adenosyltransferase|uniref:cob(I)yrinic acid a,c-diamide adenosyltransferase n=1 Tax=Candidatus Izimoplasma sp. HR1 TaxID=1541959 RepID=UPI0004F6BA81|nr:Cob(I)yrinic acid a,c-diamide adenosyltransferase [Candidatus Izimaplasma bacterium HR1]